MRIGRIDPAGGLNCDGTNVNSHGYNLDSTTECGLDLSSDQETADPALGPLAKNGGPTKTLLPGSTSDARSEPAAGACDVGAVEIP